jgi:hypothetical protein
MPKGIRTASRAGLSITEFARREGVSNTLVHQALKNGRLQAYPDGSVDPLLLGTPWRKGNVTTADAAPVAGPVEPAGATLATLKDGQLTYADALRLKEISLARLRQLEYDEKSGALIELLVAERVIFEAFRKQRDSWLNWPMRIGPLLAADLNCEVELVTNALTAYAHKHIAELGEPEADFNQG